MNPYLVIGADTVVHKPLRGFVRSNFFHSLPQCIGHVNFPMRREQLQLLGDVHAHRALCALTLSNGPGQFLGVGQVAPKLLPKVVVKCAAALKLGIIKAHH